MIMKGKLIIKGGVSKKGEFICNCAFVLFSVLTRLCLLRLKSIMRLDKVIQDRDQ